MNPDEPPRVELGFEVGDRVVEACARPLNAANVSLSLAKKCVMRDASRTVVRAPTRDASQIPALPAHPAP